MNEDTSGPAPIAIVEDVWGPAFEPLARRSRILWEPEAWQDRQALLTAAAGARALIIRNRTRADEVLLKSCPRLEVIGRAGVGLDNIDLDAAGRYGVPVVAPLRVNAVSVAEHALTLALTLARQVVPLDARCRTGGWDRVPGRELSGRTWGTLGAGTTARACLRQARALGMDIVAYDPYVDPSDPELTELGVHLLSLNDIARHADVLSCHLPATPETRELVDDDVLRTMKRSAVFVNVGRGETVDEQALADALEAGVIAGAGLDVRTIEPPEPDRLGKLDNVVLTPHIAGITLESQEAIVRILADDIDAVLHGEPPTHNVTPTVPRRNS